MKTTLPSSIYEAASAYSSSSNLQGNGYSRVSPSFGSTHCFWTRPGVLPIEGRIWDADIYNLLNKASAASVGVLQACRKALVRAECTVKCQSAWRSSWLHEVLAHADAACFMTLRCMQQKSRPSSPMGNPHCSDIPALLCDGLDSLQHTKLVLYIQKGRQLIQQQQLWVFSKCTCKNKRILR